MHKFQLNFWRCFTLCCAIFTASVLTYAADFEEEFNSAITPEEDPIKLFNGKDMEGLYTWLSDTGHEDPREVFTVKEGMINISGDGYGAVLTKQNYKNYHCVLEFKWESAWGKQVDKARDSGLLFTDGSDGGYNNIWPNSIEAQIIEGGVGDVLAVRGTDAEGNAMPMSVTAEIVLDRDGEKVWHKGGEKVTIQGGRINWYGRDPDWADVINFRGKEDVESETGEWTRMDVICEGDKAVIIVNGVIVNEIFDLTPQAGRLLVQTEGAELFVRRWELWPLGKAPEFDAADLKKE
ncbi:MAG: DUF1080 domain-containing protein [Planctomycetaceae bacterium]